MKTILHALNPLMFTPGTEGLAFSQPPSLSRLCSNGKLSAETAFCALVADAAALVPI